MKLSIVIPVLNEGITMNAFLSTLKATVKNDAEIIVVDGSSNDHATELAHLFADQVLQSPPGRAKQMNAGALASQGNLLLFLHADTRLPTNVVSILKKSWDSGAVWGRFDVKLSGHHFLFRIIESLMNWRSKWSGIATGDQAMFVRKDIFTHLRGFPEIRLMEDIALSKTLKKIAPPTCITSKVLTSSRRWEVHGILRTIFLMWYLRLKYFFGADPNQLAKQYQ